MSDHKSSYRQIMKATTLFGGVQVFQILISIIRSKFVAILLGPKGMGIVELLRSTIQIISSLTNMGIGTSAIKNVAAANATNNQNKISITIIVLRRLVWGTGLLGATITFILAPWLSQLTFGNNEFTFAYQWLSVTFIFGQLSSGQIVLLQGLRKLQHLAKANIIGSSIGLCITIPIYYIWGINGIVPVLISSSIISLIVSYYFAKKIKIKNIFVSRQTTFNEGKSMLGMGLALSVSGFLTILEAYIIRIYISTAGNIEDVGLFSAGFAIIGTYTGLVLNAMSTDYYPRLSEVITDQIKTNKTVNDQAEIAILIIAPLLTLFLIFIDWGVILLYSREFLPVSDMIHWAALGVFFKASSWSMGFIILAKGDKKWYFISSIIKITYVFALNILGYKYYGLTGLGISFLIAYILGFIQNMIITRYLYSFSFEKYFFRIFTILFFIALIGFWVSYTLESYSMYIVGIILIIISSAYSIFELNKRINILGIIEERTNKFKKK